MTDARETGDNSMRCEALEKSVGHYRSLIEAMNEGFATTDENYVFTYVNLRFAEILGHASEELVGHQITEFLDEANQDIMRVQIAERRAGHYERYELVWTAKDGQRVYTLISPRPVFDDDGRFAGSFGVLTDISELKRTEEALRESESKYRELFHNSNDAIFVVASMPDKMPGLFLDVNDVACRRLGYSREELLRMGPQDIDDSETIRSIPRVAREIFQHGHGTFEITQLHKDGHPIPSEVSYHLFDFSGKKVVLAIVRDITARKLADEERRTLEKHLEEQKRLFYRETLLSVTDGKLAICEECDFAAYTQSAELTIMNVHTAQGTSAARHKIKDFCREHGLGGEPLGLFISGVGEAITNAVKHGGVGNVYAGVRDTLLWVGVEDNGPGIESLILPRATLLRGFSTKPSMGLGYCIMLDVADRVLLKTDEQGTSVVLEKQLEEQIAEPSIQLLPDTWDNISI